MASYYDGRAPFFQWRMQVLWRH